MARISNPIAKLDREAARKRRKEEAKQEKVNKKRLKEFTSISPVGKKTRWYY